MAREKSMAKFDKKVEKLVLQLGGKETYKWESSTGWTIETKAGKLDVSVHHDKSSIYSIFCRFDDPKKAVEVLTPTNASNLNKHSGKWNYHMSDEKEILAIFESSVREIL